jgi:hypothetical protein
MVTRPPGGRAIPAKMLAGAAEQPKSGFSEESENGQTLSCRDLRDGDDSRHSSCRFRVLPKLLLEAAGSEYRHCLGFRSFLLPVLQASMTSTIRNLDGGIIVRATGVRALGRSSRAYPAGAGQAHFSSDHGKTVLAAQSPEARPGDRRWADGWFRWFEIGVQFS